VKKPIWHSSKKGTARTEFVKFSAGRDVLPLPGADEILVPYDIWTNQAHAIGLHRIDVFSAPQLQKILQALTKLETEWTRGSWKLDPALEDVHINIESYISETCGEELGGRLHSGRSRNDQVAADMKLYARDVVLNFANEIHELLKSLLAHAHEHIKAPMPGYTHHRKATITTWGHWCASYCQALLRDADRLMSIYARINTCPLGAAAAYGTTWPLDRKLVAELLAFDSVQENTLDAVRNRGEAEAEITHALFMLMKRLAGISQDLILFSTDEFGYLSLPQDFTTGSSIMPQKRNPDFAEAIKGKAYVLLGYVTSLLAIDGSNLSGYNKDVQWSKYLFMDAVREASGAATLLANVFQGMNVHRNRMENAAQNGFLNAVDLADHLARTRSLPFRTTYHLLSDAVGSAQQNHFTFDEINQLLSKHKITRFTDKEFASLQNPNECVNARNHIGGPKPKHVKNHLMTISRKNVTFKKWIEKENEKIVNSKKRCSHSG
jgi:argininosuccinate lyase